MATNYTWVYFFAKHTSLLQWFDVKYHCEIENKYQEQSLGFNQLRQSYAKPRDVQLILLVRYEGNRIFCKVKCPINPLPIKGEFEAASLNAVISFLSNEGWKLKEKLPFSLLK